MSDNESPVLVEPEDLIDENTPHAVQIVAIEEDARFELQTHAWRSLLAQIPPSSPVAIVSVVGAFRTGKSFLLSWFLNFLRTETQNDKNVAPAFEWKAGSERHTTGVWMWSEPLQYKGTTILLVDTQGMFDHETTMALTASIFGLSTLLSSYQIYNVDKRIQEDHLQQLALFSEYARAALEDSPGEEHKPFQQLEFLVRDWQHFEDDDDEHNLEALEQSMTDYLDTVLKEREAKDLKDTRDQIVSCFEQVSCYGLPHPGFAVTKKKYGGEVDVLEKLFVQLLDRYCRRILDTVQPKQIHGRTVTASELGTYVEAYADLFRTGTQFPTAATLLEATATANNTNAVHMSVHQYKSELDRKAGPSCTIYVPPEQVKELHVQHKQASLSLFDSMAKFGPKAKIEESKREVVSQISEQWTVYESLNESRNPLRGLELYV